MEQMRPAADDESKGVEVVNQFLDSMRMDFRRARGPKKYLDVTREGDPSFRDDEQMEALSDDEDAATRTLDTRLSRLEQAENLAPIFVDDKVT